MNNINQINPNNKIVRTSFGLDPKIGLGPGPTSSNNEFVERGRKN